MEKEELLCKIKDILHNNLDHTVCGYCQNSDSYINKSEFDPCEDCKLRNLSFTLSQTKADTIAGEILGLFH